MTAGGKMKPSSFEEFGPHGANFVVQYGPDIGLEQH